MDIQSLTVVSSAIIFLVITLLLVVVLLVAKHYLVPSGKIHININGKKDLEVETGSSLLATLSNNGVHLPSACGGKGSCGQCKVRVPEGGGNILPTETVHFSRKEQQAHWRLGCQVKVKEDMKIAVDDSVL